MATQFQNRLIGTVILVSLGVVFLPDLLMGKKNDISAPTGSIPLRPEQSLAGVATGTQNTTTSSSVATATPASSGTVSGNPVVVSDTVSVAANNVPVSAASSAVVANKENWQIEEVAAPVTITENGAVSDKEVVAVNNEPQDSMTDVARKKAREQEELRKQELLAAAKAKAAALEAKRKAEQLALSKPDTVTMTEKPVTDVQTTVRRDESGITIKTPAQVEAERAALKSGSSVSATTTYKPASKPAAGGSWMIQVGVFSNAENAKALAAKLRSAGYSASAQRSGQLTRVVVGPDVSKDKLQSMLSGINRVGGTSARIISYSSIN